MTAIAMRVAARTVGGCTSPRKMSTMAEVTSPKAKSVSGQILITGASGRVGQSFSKELERRKIAAVKMPREKFQATQKEIAAYIRENKIVRIVNLAGIHKGTRDELQKVNVENPKKLAEVAEDLGVPFLHLSTTATQVPNVTEDHLYASTKGEAENALMGMSNTKILRADALLDRNHSGEVHLGHSAGIGPFRIHLKGGEQIIQPTTYDACVKVLIEAALMGDDAPKIVNIAGEPISVCDFLRLANPKARYEIHVCPEKLKDITNLVENGAFSKDFLELSKLCKQSPVVHDNAAFRKLHVSPIPSPAEVAEEVQNMSMLGKFKLFRKIYTEAPDKMHLVELGIQALVNAEVKTPK